MEAIAVREREEEERVERAEDEKHEKRRIRKMEEEQVREAELEDSRRKEELATQESKEKQMLHIGKLPGWALTVSLLKDLHVQRAAGASKLEKVTPEGTEQISQEDLGENAESKEKTEETREKRRRRWKEESRRKGRESAEFLSGILGNPLREVAKEQEETRVGREAEQERKVAELNEVQRVAEEAERLKPVGVGIAITNRSPYRVTELVEGGAAARSGSIQVGDFILWVAGVDITSKPFQEVKSLILGPRGSQLKLKLDRRSDDGHHNIYNTVISRAAPLSEEAAARTQNRLSRAEGTAMMPVNRVNMSVVEQSPFPSRPPPSLRMPARSPAPLPPSFD